MARSNAKALQRYEDSVSLTRFYRILTSKNKINNKFACNLLIRIAKINNLAAVGNLFYTLVYKQNGLEKLSQKDLVHRVKTCTFAPSFTKIHKNSSNAETEI